MFCFFSLGSGPWTAGSGAVFRPEARSVRADGPICASDLAGSCLCSGGDGRTGGSDWSHVQPESLSTGIRGPEALPWPALHCRTDSSPGRCGHQSYTLRSPRRRLCGSAERSLRFWFALVCAAWVGRMDAESRLWERHRAGLVGGEPHPRARWCHVFLHASTALVQTHACGREQSIMG